jgi:hypothetical protein
VKKLRIRTAREIAEALEEFSGAKVMVSVVLHPQSM